MTYLMMQHAYGICKAPVAVQLHLYFSASDSSMRRDNHVNVLKSRGGPFPEANTGEAAAGRLVVAGAGDCSRGRLTPLPLGIAGTACSSLTLAR